MLDLVKQETKRVDSTFLEPACGNGNFLAAILKRKLAIVDIIGKGKPGIWESESIKASRIRLIRASCVRSSQFTQ